MQGGREKKEEAGFDKRENKTNSEVGFGLW
jgi:hypothetical protein